MTKKRDVLERVAEKGYCSGFYCNTCEYKEKCSRVMIKERLAKIGAKTILRMFPKKKKPTLDVGMKIKFENGKIGVLEKEKNAYIIRFEDSFFHWDYLIGKVWEIIE